MSRWERRRATFLCRLVVRGLRPVFCGLALGVGGAAALSALLHSTLAGPGFA